MVRIKFNYRCPKGTVSPDSYECPAGEKPVSEKQPSTKVNIDGGIKRSDGSVLKLRPVPGADDYFDMPEGFADPKFTPWIARVRGTSKQYGIDREFLNRYKIGKSDVWRKGDLKEGEIYEMAARSSRSRGTNRVYFKVEKGELKEVTDKELIPLLKQKDEERAKKKQEEAERKKKEEEQKSIPQDSSSPEFAAWVKKGLKERLPQIDDLMYEDIVAAVTREMKRRHLIK